MTVRTLGVSIGALLFFMFLSGSIFTFRVSQRKRADIIWLCVELTSDVLLGLAIIWIFFII